MQENKDFLMENDLTEAEADEVIAGVEARFLDEVRDISLYESAKALAKYYLNTVVGTLDPKVADAIDLARLAMNVASDTSKYFVLSSGRIVEFV